MNHARRPGVIAGILLVLTMSMLLLTPVAQAAGNNGSAARVPADASQSATASSVQSVAAATAPSIAVTWGFNTWVGGFGNLPPSTQSNPSYRPLASAIGVDGALAGKSVTAISTSEHGTSCAVASGAAYCWGTNYRGMGGVGEAESSDVPRAVVTSGALAGKTVTAITQGESHTCAIASGKPYCWGSNEVGQLGNGSTDSSWVPAAVKTDGVLAGKTVTAISAGGYHTCVVASGRVYCWGENIVGELGIGNTTNSPIPVAVSTIGVLNGRTITAIAAGYRHTCALSAGTVACWGDGDYYQLGNGSPADSAVPVGVAGLGGPASKIAAGWNKSCAVVGGKITCWGQTGGRVPTLIAPGALAGKVVIAVAVAIDHLCAIADGRGYCTGQAWISGDGTNMIRREPVAITPASAVAARRITALAAGPNINFAVAGPVTFPDVVAGQNFYDNIIWIATNGITGGYADGSFKPTALVTRQAMAAFLYRAANPGSPDLTCDARVARTFTDMPTGSQFCGAVEWTAQSGMTPGGGAFRPTDPMSRQDIAAFIWRLQHQGATDPKCTGGARKFTDVPASNPLCGAIEALAVSGVITGYSDNTYRPTVVVSRQATAAFLNRAFG